jgi:hypothetical protein
MCCYRLAAELSPGASSEQPRRGGDETNAEKSREPGEVSASDGHRSDGVDAAQTIGPASLREAQAIVFGGRKYEHELIGTNEHRRWEAIDEAIAIEALSAG